MTSLIYSHQIKKYLTNKESLEPFFYWKARIALYALLHAMGVQKDDEVILPAFTCVVVPNAILYLGAKPVYIDVCADHYNMDVSQVGQAISDRTKVIICQNTYGLSTDLEALNDLAKAHNLYTIEDCTHGFGGVYNSIPNGLSCDAAIYSTQWNKPFSTGIGGFAITRHKDISRQLERLNADLIQPSIKERVNLKLLYFVKRFLINDTNYLVLVRFYRWLSMCNLVVGSSSGGEISSTIMPDGYFKAFSETQAKQGLRTLPKLNADLTTRKQSAKIYTDFLIQHGKNHVARKWYANHAFLKYPLLVNNRDEFIRLAEQHRIALGEWFISPLHPVKGDLSAWQFDAKQYPIATYLASHVVNLSTTPLNINKVLGFLEQQCDYILDYAKGS